MRRIQIKSHFTNWHYVTEEQAKKYVMFLLKNITAMSDQKKIDYINSNRLKNVTIEELLTIRPDHNGGQV